MSLMDLPGNIANLHPELLQPHTGRWPEVPGIAVIGGGRWGRNLIRNFYQLHALEMVCDLSEDTRQQLKSTYPSVGITADVVAVLANPAVDAVVIATPTHTHAALATQALQAGKHVYVEKPLATSAADVDALITLAKQVNRQVMVGHLLLYHPAVIRLRQLVAQGALGDIRYIHSTRLNVNPARPDSTVLWDLGPHDLSLMATVVGVSPSKLVSAHGQRVGSDGKIDHARMTVTFDLPYGTIEGELTNSWVHPIKQVRLSVFGTKAIALLDDTQPGQPITLMPNPTSDTTLESLENPPEVLAVEPLAMECQHFLNAIREGTAPNTDAAHARQIVALLEQAHQQF